MITHVEAAVADRRARWVPSREQRAVAAAMLTAVPPNVEHVLVPLVQPGKEFGIWIVGQVVEVVPGFWLADALALPDNPYSFTVARTNAIDAAAKQLGDRPGTVGWAVIGRDGHAAVFEDFYTNPAED